MKYRKKPVVIDAWQFNGEDGMKWPKWIHEWRTPEGLVAYFLEGKIWIPTLEGMMTGQPGDWIIRGIRGELYPCKDDIFKATYEKVDG